MWFPQPNLRSPDDISSFILTHVGYPLTTQLIVWRTLFLWLNFLFVLRQLKFAMFVWHHLLLLLCVLRPSRISATTKTTKISLFSYRDSFSRCRLGSNKCRTPSLDESTKWEHESMTWKSLLRIWWNKLVLMTTKDRDLGPPKLGGRVYQIINASVDWIAAGFSWSAWN